MTVKIYAEGGGDGKALRIRCQKAFFQFFERAGLKGRMPAVVACGSRSDAYDRFCTAASATKAGDFPVLLADSEARVTKSPWQHLKDHDGWDRPDRVDDQQVQLMVECMEAWFFADVDSLSKYSGQGFVRKHVEKDANVEAIAKNELFKALKMATKQCKKFKNSGGYSKGAHSFEILGQIDLSKVRKASEHADRLLKALDEKC